MTSFQAGLLVAPPIVLWTIVMARPSTTWTGTVLFLYIFPVYLDLLAACTIAYRLSPFHPLARYPGPVGARISKFWMAFKCLGGHQHHYIRSLHQRYGDVVRTGTSFSSLSRSRDPDRIFRPERALHQRCVRRVYPSWSIRLTQGPAYVSAPRARAHSADSRHAQTSSDVSSR